MNINLLYFINYIQQLSFTKSYAVLQHDVKHVRLFPTESTCSAPPRDSPKNSRTHHDYSNDHLPPIYVYIPVSLMTAARLNVRAQSRLGYIIHTCRHATFTTEFY